MHDRLPYLFERHLSQTCTPEEKQEFIFLSLEAEHQAQLKELIGQAWEQTGEEESVSDEARTKLFETAFPKRVHRMLWLRVAAAVLIIGLIGLGYLYFSRSDVKTPVAKVNDTEIAAPANNRAMITMGDGKAVFLDSVSNGTIATVGNVKVTKLSDGQISYTGTTTEVAYNTLTNPRGSKVINMTLSDGSRVWLNAGSSVTYPVSFTGNERKVSMRGEAYFEVAPSISPEGGVKRPFIVSKGDMSVQVLGTHFNVNAYDDEPSVKVTLLEGSVKVTSPNPSEGGAMKSVIIKPGEQADDHLRVVKDVNVEEVMAWKNGYFSFKNADLQTILRQASRWYDVDVSFESNVPKVQFSGEIGKALTLTQFLNILNETRIHYKIEERKLIIIP